MTPRTFKLGRPTLGLGKVGGKQRVVAIPAEAILKIVDGQSDSGGMVKALWGTRTVAMFAIDLSLRGTEITDPRARSTRRKI